MQLEGKSGAWSTFRTRRCQFHCAAKLLLYLCFTKCLDFLLVNCRYSDSMLTNSTMNSNMTLVSQNGVFEVGFTSSGSVGQSSVYTLGIWYAQPPTPSAKTVVWIADRSMALSSINDTSLRLSEQGDLQVYNKSGGNSSRPVIWTSNTANLNVTSATILDTGNLVLLNRANQVVWQSFDSPTNTLLPNQTFLTNSSRVITAWQSGSDWSEGKYSLKWVNASDLIAYWQNPYTWYTSPNNTYWPSPEYSTNGSSKSSYAVLTPNGEFQSVGFGGNSTLIAKAAVDGVSSRLFRITLDEDGNIRMYSWSTDDATWTVEWKAIMDICSVSGHCGPNAICDLEKCKCPDGFHLVDTTDQRQGCERMKPVACGNTSAEVADTFTPVQYADWGLYADWGNGPDVNYFDKVNVSTCMDRCLALCECQAAVMTIPTSGNEATVTCWLKKAALLNGTSSSNRQSYLRIAGSLDPPNQSRAPMISRVPKILASAVGAVAMIFALLSCAFGSFCFSRKMEERNRRRLQAKWVAAKGSMIRFTYRESKLMTGNFETKIGEGGFGTVFKGQIGVHPQSVAVAVKRLNKQLTSQIEKEFLKEVDSIGRIHHVHLVSLLGYCAEAEHRLLVYEYVEKGSLDRVLFRGSTKSPSPVLEWRPRFAIAIQTARGLAYLHDDCSQQIIHCDVKPENILLDSMNLAKVADFGLSRIMNHDQTRVVTKHICGTQGYLAPDWMSDRVTNKVDVFSYGMVLLEIISGRRNLMTDSPRCQEDHVPSVMYYPTWAFRKIKTEAFMEVVDPALTGIVNPEEVRRALQVAFRCINDKPQLRPSMSEVVKMLQGQVAIDLPVPMPEFFKTVDFPDLEFDDDDSNYSSSSLLVAASSGLHDLTDSSPSLVQCRVPP